MTAVDTVAMMSDSQNDSELLGAYVERGDQAAFASLVRRYTDFVYATARRQAREQAEDVMQAVFILLARKARSLMHKTHLSGWLYLSTMNIARNARRGEKRRRAYEASAAAEMKVATGPERMEYDLDAVLERLSGGERDILLLRYFREMAYPEIAEALGTSESAARVRVTRAIHQLRKKLGSRAAVMEIAGVEAMLLAHAHIVAPTQAVAAASAVIGAVKSGTSAALPATGLLKGSFLLASAKAKLAMGLAAAIVLAAGSMLALRMMQTPNRQLTLRMEAKPLTGAGVTPASDGAQTPEQFRRMPTPNGALPTFKGRVEGLSDFKDAEVGVISLRNATWLFPSHYQWEKVNADGTFAITAHSYPQAKRVLAVRAKGRAVTYLRAEFAPTESGKDIVLRMKPSKMVTLIMKDHTGRPLSNFRVEVFRGRVEHDDQGRKLRVQQYALVVGKGAETTLPVALEPTAFLVSTDGEAPFYCIVDTSQADRFEFKLMQSCTITGLVTCDGKPVKDANVYLKNPAAQFSDIFCRADENGVYTLPNGVPGTYIVKYDGKQTTLQIGEGETKTVDFAVGSKDVAKGKDGNF